MTYLDRDNLIIRCNWCEHIFVEDDLYVDEEDREACPDCQTRGCLMDLGIFGKEDDDKLFPELSKTNDWYIVKKNFDLKTLCFFENEIYDYEFRVGDYADDEVDNYPTIIQWFEGLMTTKELIECYG